MKTVIKDLNEMLLERLYVNKCTVNLKIFHLCTNNIKNIMEIKIFNGLTHPVAKNQNNF